MRILAASIITAILAMTISHPKISHAASLAAGLHQERLANGVSLIVRESPGSKAVTVQIWVKAGSTYEDEHERGITHLIEHMIFKGTDSRGPGDIAGGIEALGGRINAYTSYDQTVYHATIAARHWRTALDILADAVLHSVFDPDELEREKKVVQEEIAMREDRPGVRLFEEFMAHAYKKHPYGLPVAGTRESVAAISRDDILAYVQKHYIPENITVVVAGDISSAEVREETERMFGGLAPAAAEEPPRPAEPERNAPEFFSLTDDMRQTMLFFGFPTVRFVDRDTPALDLVAAILGQGETSRLYRRLRNELGIVYRIHASSFTPRDRGLMEFSADIDPQHAARVMKEALTQIFLLKYVKVGEDELERARRNLESDFVFSMEKVEGQARVLGSFHMLTGDPDPERYLEGIRAVTRDDILAVAKRYFQPEKLVAGMISPENLPAGMDADELEKIAAEAEQDAKEGVSGALVANSYLPDLYRFRLENGITLLVREDFRVPTVAIRAIFPGGLRAETEETNGAFAAIAQILPKGTEKMDHDELAARIEDMAGDIEGFNGRNTFGLRADFLARYADEALALVRDIILTPAFAPDEVEKLKPELLSQLKEQEDSLPSLAFREFNRLLFAGHPYGLNVLGSREAIKNFTAASLRQMYRRHARPDRLVLSVVGAVKAADVKKRVEKLFSGWRPEDKDTIIEDLLVPPPPARPVNFNLERDKAQVHIVLGFRGTSLKNPDRFALEVLDTVLSGQSGRLFATLRDQESLAYSLSSFNVSGIDTGSFGVYIGTGPEKRDQAMSALWRELYRVRNEEISADELKKAQNLIIGNYELGLQTHAAQALETGLNETYGLGQDYGTRYIEAISKVTPADVMAVAQKYIQPEHYCLVTVGAPNAASEKEKEEKPE